jgi:TolB-like protein
VSAYWSVARGEAIRTSSPNRTEVLAGARDPGGDMLLLAVKQFSMTRDMSSNFSITPTYSIQLYDWATGKLTKEIDGLRSAIRGVAIAPIRTIVATADEKGQVSLWNISQNRDVASASMTDYPIGLAFTADGRYLATTGEKGNVFVWKASGVSPNHVVARVYDTEGLLTKGKYEITTATDPLFGPRDSFSMAILGLNALGVDATLTRTVDNLIAARFADYGNLKLVERDAVDRVLKEVKFQNSGLTSVQDAAKIGSMLNAEKVVVGSVNQLGTSVVVSLRIVESATARINGAREVMCNDCTAEDLPKALSLLVRAVMGAR